MEAIISLVIWCRECIYILHNFTKRWSKVAYAVNESGNSIIRYRYRLPVLLESTVANSVHQPVPLPNWIITLGVVVETWPFEFDRCDRVDWIFLRVYIAKDDVFVKDDNVTAHILPDVLAGRLASLIAWKELITASNRGSSGFHLGSAVCRTWFARSIFMDMAGPKIEWERHGSRTIREHNPQSQSIPNQERARHLAQKVFASQPDRSGASQPVQPRGQQDRFYPLAAPSRTAVIRAHRTAGVDVKLTYATQRWTSQPRRNNRPHT
jgi:hypothetical protein